jgi:hypothetical protein
MPPGRSGCAPAAPEEGLGRQRVRFNDKGHSMHTRRQFGVAVLGLAALALLLAGTGGAQAGYMVTLLEQNGNVVATGSGKIDLTGLSFTANDVGFAFVNPSIGSIGIGPANPIGTAPPTDIYSGISGPSNFGSGGNQIASSGNGNPVEIEPSLGGGREVASDYVSDSNSLSNTSTYNGQTFASLGVTPGTYVWEWGAEADQSFTLQIGPAATAAPEPASLTLLGIGALGLLGYGWRRRKQAAA